MSTSHSTLDALLDEVWAKSVDWTGRTGRAGHAERLTEHSRATWAAARMIAGRIGTAGVLAGCPAFWALVALAALLHDAGKVAEGFQRQVKLPGHRWGERHEVLSLAYVSLFACGLPADERALVAAGVGLHHRWLCSAGGSGALRDLYPRSADWERKFGHDPDPPPGQPAGQVPLRRHRRLLAWYADQLGVSVPADGDRRLWQRARDQFGELRAAWEQPVDERRGLVAVLLHGAVTLADHSASAHVALHTHLPLPEDYLSGLPYQPYPHQRQAAGTDGHLVLVAPTGSGKTESGLAWASRQLSGMPGQPRVVWVLPYRASIDAAAARFAQDLTPAPGQTAADIGVLHGSAALSVLADAVSEDCAATAVEARKASARAGAMRLFAQRFRVATAYQLLIGAIAGPRYASVLLEQANSLIVLDELHAYDPQTFGRLCACLRLWEELGSRVAVLSATLAPPMVELIRETLRQPLAFHRAPVGTAPDRHRLVLDEQPLTAPASLDLVRSWLGDGHSVLLVANTVATAQALYTALAPAAREAAGVGNPDAALLLHSRFRARDRAIIERRLLTLHSERRPGQPARRGGLVVATQAVEVSLRLDFDRGATELAPIEAVAQRAGRINRLGRHPDGPVPYRVHRGESPHPYQPEALEAAWSALADAPGPVMSEQTIDHWLTLAYRSDWGRRWTDEARRSRDAFDNTFLSFTEPFTDREEFLDGLRESFDTIEVLLHDDQPEYERLTTGPDGHALLGAGLLIPIRYSQWRALDTTGTVGRRIPVVDAPYSPETGLDLSRTDRRTGTVTRPGDTIL
ncbi:CRISPR-associated helicase Cas3' [Micromonospora sp. NBC_01405]|uniref:CRISPR-associated helicase Cas3' n=1 Tax=Micromonospora sp. NBC_01405 TaxID=2903589 RepID=UPI003251698C